MADDSKTEKPTSKRRGDARKKGNVFMSRDTVSLVSLVVGSFMLKTQFPNMYSKLGEFMQRYIGYTLTQRDVTDSLIFKISRETITAAVSVAMPVIGITVLASIVATIWQTKLLFTMEPIRPKFSKLNPLTGIKNLFAMRNLVELLKSLLKIIILFAILYNFYIGKMHDFPRLLDMDALHASTYLLKTCYALVMQVVMAFTAISILDYFYQKWEYEKSLKMSKQEVKEEYKQAEGDPKIKGAIRGKQRKMAMQRMMQQVPLADVVIRNPTHFAVALKYDIDKDNAPIVVAKGQDELALRIVKVAEEHDIYVIENKPLARAIYATTDLEREIPMEFYGTIAEILVTVYKIKNKSIM